MPEPSLLARSALHGVAKPGRFGVCREPPGLVLGEVTGVEIVGLAARRGREAAVTGAVQDGWNVQLPVTPRVAEGRGVAFLWSGAGQWLVVAPANHDKLEQRLRAACGDAASITAQGNGRAVLHLGGSAVRAVLSTLVAIDLHPRAFRPGDTAITLANHVGVQLRQLDDSARFELLVARSYAESLFEAVLEAGLRFGVEVRPPS